MVKSKRIGALGKFGAQATTGKQQANAGSGLKAVPTSQIAAWLGQAEVSCYQDPETPIDSPIHKHFI